MLCKEVGGGGAQPAGAPGGERPAPHLEEAEEQAGRLPRSAPARPPARPEAHQPSAGATGRLSPAEERAALLLTPSALLIDANGSVRWGETAFFLSLGNSKFKNTQKQQKAEAAAGSLVQWRRVTRRPQAPPHSLPAPNLRQRGPKINPEPGAIPACRQTKTSPGAEPQSGFALRAVTRKWHYSKGSYTLVFSRGFFHDTLKYLSPTLSQMLSHGSETIMSHDSPKNTHHHSQPPLCETRKHLAAFWPQVLS